MVHLQLSPIVLKWPMFLLVSLSFFNTKGCHGTCAQCHYIDGSPYMQNFSSPQRSPIPPHGAPPQPVYQYQGAGPHGTCDESEK